MLQIVEGIPEKIKLTGDTLAIFGWISALSGALTEAFGLLAAILSFAWAAIRLYETKTVQGWFTRRRSRK